jgi:hypothetical protein
MCTSSEQRTHPSPGRSPAGGGGHGQAEDDEVEEDSDRLLTHGLDFVPMSSRALNRGALISGVFRE